MKNLILNTENCRIYSDKNGIILEMKMEDGGWVQQCPFKHDLSGLIAALTLSVDVIAGKVWLKKVVDDKPKLNNKLLS